MEQSQLLWNWNGWKSPTLCCKPLTSILPQDPKYMDPFIHNPYTYSDGKGRPHIFYPSNFTMSWRIWIYVFSVLHLHPLNTELNPICHLLALLGAHHILHVSRIRVNVSILCALQLARNGSVRLACSDWLHPQCNRQSEAVLHRALDGHHHVLCADVRTTTIQQQDLGHVQPCSSCILIAHDKPIESPHSQRGTWDSRCMSQH